MTTTFAIAADAIECARDYYAFFGPAPGDPTVHVKRTYLHFARLVHPDLHVGTTTRERAEAAFKQLGEFNTQALSMVAQNMYGQPTELISWKSRRGTHRALRVFRDTELCMVYAAQSKLVVGNEQASYCRVVKASADNDLMQNEAKALRQLRGPNTDEALHIFFPELLDSFAHREAGKAARQVNVVNALDGFYDLTQVEQAHPGGVPAIHMGWIWRRVLWALAHAHKHDLVHGAMLPEHIMVLPDKHGVVLANWCYASKRDDAGEFAPVKAIVSAYKDWYPEEVFAKAAPSPATDLIMAARCMIQLMGGDPIFGNFPNGSPVPRPFRAFFRGCLGASQLTRPQDALQLLGEFDQLLERLGPPYYPRTFRVFTMPSGTVKN